MLAVDTNVLVYAANADSQFRAPCRDWLGEHGIGRICTPRHRVIDPLRPYDSRAATREP